MVWLSETLIDFSPVVEIKRVVSGKGYIILCQDFDCFLWNNDKALQHLLVAVSAWSDIGTGKTLEVHRDISEKRGFVIKPATMKNKPVQCSWRLTPMGFTTKPLEPEDFNPFL
jgi:hypothetical protein